MQNWNNLPEEEKWYYEEPQKPRCLIEEEISQEQEQREITAPDILG